MQFIKQFSALALDATHLVKCQLSVIQYPLLQWSPPFLALGISFMENNFSPEGWTPGLGQGDSYGFEMIQVHQIYCTRYFYYPISTTSDHQELDPGGWGPLLSCLTYEDSETRENKLVSTVPGIPFSILSISQACDSVQF